MALPVDMDEQNLGFLKRRDPDAEEILGSSGHVTMYIMSVEMQKWERRNVEGTLYVIKRRTNPRFQMVVLNKLSTENYVETIESGFHAEVSPPYLIYTQGGGKVHGVWFYEEADLNRIAALLTKVESGLPKSPTLAVENQASDAVAAPANDDGGFWDKPKKAAPPAEQVSPAPPPANALTNLFKNIQVKQQPQTTPAPQVATPPAASAMPLPPAFFQQQQQQQAPPPAFVNKNLDHLRTAAVLSPAASADMAGGSFTATHDSVLSKIFSKQAPPPPPPPPPPATAVAPASANALAALFSNAAIKSAAPGGPPHQAGTPAAATAPQVTPPRQAAGRPVVDDRLKTALSRLVVRDEFLSLLSEELRSVGLLQ